MGGTSFTISIASAGLAVFLFFLALYVYSLAKKDNHWADVGWPIAFILGVAVVLWQRNMLDVRQLLVTSVVFVWGVRLALHIWLRGRGKGEDWWHRAWRRSWGEHWVLRSFLQIYLLRSVYVVVIALPALWVVTFPGPPLSVLDVVGLALWGLGFAWEVVGDHQLVRFKDDKKNKGHVLQCGLWRYSRHPNYFGEVLMWFGIWFIALSVPGSFVTVVGPLLILALLVWIQSIPILEKHFSSNPEYLAYQQRTSRFVPWFPGNK